MFLSRLTYPDLKPVLREPMRCGGHRGESPCGALLCYRSVHEEYFQPNGLRIAVSLKCPSCSEERLVVINDLKQGRWKQFHCARCERFLARLDMATIRLYIRCRRCKSEAEIRLLEVQPDTEMASNDVPAMSGSRSLA